MRWIMMWLDLYCNEKMMTVILSSYSGYGGGMCQTLICIKSCAAAVGEAKGGAQTLKSRSGSIHKVIGGRGHAGCSVHTCLHTVYDTSESVEVESTCTVTDAVRLTSDFSILFWASTCVMISFMLVSRTIPPITISARMLCTWGGIYCGLRKYSNLKETCLELCGFLAPI